MLLLQRPCTRQTDVVLLRESHSVHRVGLVDLGGKLMREVRTPDILITNIRVDNLFIFRCFCEYPTPVI